MPQAAGLVITRAFNDHVLNVVSSPDEEQRKRFREAACEFRGLSVKQAHERLAEKDAGLFPYQPDQEDLSVMALAAHVSARAFGPMDFFRSRDGQIHMDGRSLQARFDWDRDQIRAVLAEDREGDAAGIVPFAFEGAPVRVVIRDEEPWFVAHDVAEALGYASPKDATRGLDSDEKGSHQMRTLGGPQKMVVISEPGLYKLIGRSDKPAARRFDRWVRHEVLPSIRKTGGYRSEASALPEASQDWRMVREQRLRDQAASKAIAAVGLAIAANAPRAAIESLIQAAEVFVGIGRLRHLLPAAEAA